MVFLMTTFLCMTNHVNILIYSFLAAPSGAQDNSKEHLKKAAQ